MIAFGDSHHPWGNLYKHQKLCQIIKEEKPDYIIHLADLYDFFTLGPFPRNPNIITPERELTKGYIRAVEMWRSIKEASPDSECIQLRGNHCKRLEHNMIKRFPEAISLVKDEELWKFPGVKTLSSHRDFIEIDNVLYCHGWKTTKAHRKHFNKSVVHGHLHTASLYMDQDYTRGHIPFFAMSVGCMIDFHAKVFDYTESKHTNWKHACGVVEDGYPRLILL